MDNRLDAVMPPHQRSFHWAGYCIGFALGGFFDGILLHQILQWHHLLSAIQRAPFSDLRVQMLADGLFHAAMYLIAVVGLWSLVRARHVFLLKGADRLLMANVMIGFGAWHVIDAVLSHWIFGLHHIRMDVSHPVLWDLLWFALFGVLMLTGGYLMRQWREPPPSGKDRRAKSRSAIGPVLVIAVVVGAAATVAPVTPSNGISTTMVILRPQATPAPLLAALQGSDSRVVWSSDKGDVWALALDKNISALTLYRHGALFVSGTLLPAGCSAWTRI